MDNYKIQSYKLRDKGYGAAFSPPIRNSKGIVTISEPCQLGEYFYSKKEADDFTFNYLKTNLNIKEENIQIC